MTSKMMRLGNSKWIKAFAIVWIFTTLALIEGFAIHFTMSSLENHPSPYSETVRMPLAYFWYWAALTPLILHLARKYPIRGQRGYRHVLVHLCALVALSL